MVRGRHEGLSRPPPTSKGLSMSTLRQNPIRLGDLLVSHGILSIDERDQVLELQREKGGAFGAIAEKLFHISPAAVERAWAEQVAEWAPRVNPFKAKVQPAALSMIERRQAWQFRVLPIKLSEEGLVICTTKGSLVKALKFTGWRISAECQFVLAKLDELGAALEKHYPMSGMSASTLVEMRSAE